MNRQVYNPFLPLNEYIPDGEPHVWGDRVYHYGSHDKEGGYTFCMQDYVVYSAPVKDLTSWRCEGITYRASQDPAYPELKYMYAPDVVGGMMADIICITVWAVTTVTADIQVRSV